MYEIELREGIVKVEEELRNQRKLTKTVFEQVDKRFEEINSKFRMIFLFTSLGFTMLVVVIILFKFIG